MLLDLLRAPQRPTAIARQPVRGGAIFLAAPPAEDEDAARRSKMKQLFGINEMEPYKQTRKEQQEEAKREALRPPDWMTATPPVGSPTLEWRASWLTLWLQDSGVNMDSVLLVEAEQGIWQTWLGLPLIQTLPLPLIPTLNPALTLTLTEQGLALVASKDVLAGATLFDVPDKALLTADAAFADPGVGRDLRIMASQAKARVRVRVRVWLG